MAERVEDAGAGGGGGEEFGDAGLGEKVVELAGEAMAVMGEGVGEPGVAPGEADGAWICGPAGAGAMGAWALAGGNEIHQAGEALAGAVEALAERADEKDVARVAQEEMGDVGNEGAENDGEVARDLGGEGVGGEGGRTDGGLGCGMRHDLSPIRGARAVQGVFGRGSDFFGRSGEI